MKNVHYINAGAGAGKTTTLVNNLKDILTEKDKNGNYLCKPSEIILTTYTKAAASEFRAKTFKKLLENEPGRPANIEVAKILDTATIGTVHSVAEQYIQRYWTLLGYSGQFNVLDEVNKNIYINRSLRDVVTDDDIQFFNQYVDDFEVKSYRNGKIFTDYEFWKDYVKEIISKMHSYDIDVNQLSLFCGKSCDVVRKLFTITFNSAEFNKRVLDFHTDLSKRASATLKGTTTLNANAVKAKAKLKPYDDFILLSAPNDDEIKKFMDSEFFKDNSKDPAVKASLISTKEYLQTCWTLNPNKGKKVQECIERIFKIAGDWAVNFDKYKQENNLLDFDDLEAKFLELLDKQEVKDDISSSIKYIFVDEFQDSNPIQLEIFQKMSDLVQIKSYWVGDPKQAIYGFRGSDSSLTTKLLSQFPDPIPGLIAGFPVNSITQCSSQLLDNSWRSIESLVQLSNEVFELSFSTGVKTEQIKNVVLKHNRPDGNIKNPIQHWHCDNYDALATRVAEILNGNDPYIDGVYNNVSPYEWRNQIIPSDIAILTSSNDGCSKIAEALRKKDIPVALAETDIRDKAEVKLVLALLKYVANKNRKYAKAELAKLWEDKNLEDILKDILAGKYDYRIDFDEKNLGEDGASTSTASVPDKLFDMLDDKLRALRGLNISAMVKGVIALLDLRNFVGKWDLANIRRENLDMLIAQAFSFEQSTALTPDSAIVSDFIDYFGKVEIETKLDQSAEGVKVATYHKSKGLEWKIVILDSLNRDNLNTKSFVGYNWVGLNLKGGYGSAELQLIPSFGSVNEEIASIIETMGNANQDNGYFKLRYGKVEGELKRLLYVGVTRARDYVITISLDEKPLKWIQNVRQDTLSSKTDVLENIAHQTPTVPGTPSYIDLWGAPKYLALYEQLNDDPAVLYKKSAVNAVKLKEFALNAETELKTLSPSKIGGKITATPTLVPDTDFTSQEIKHGTITDAAEFGTCIHNYFAAHVWDGNDQVANHQDNNIALAKATVANHGKQAELQQPELLTNAADTLFTYLEKTFGAGELLRECPFTYCRDNGQLVSGEIDLVWKLENGECILVDYKNFPATGGFGKKTVLDNKPDNAHYVGHYFPQLNEYRTALEAASLTVKKVFIFYAVLGCLVEVEF